MFLVNYVQRNVKASWHRTNAGRANVHKQNNFNMLYEAFSRSCVKWNILLWNMANNDYTH